MDPNNINDQMGNERHYYYPDCWLGCNPSNPYWATIWGGIFILSGAAWLLFNLNLISGLFLDILWPMFLIGIGLAYLVWAYQKNSKNIS